MSSNPRPPISHLPPACFPVQSVTVRCVWKEAVLATHDSYVRFRTVSGRPSQAEPEQLLGDGFPAE